MKLQDKLYVIEKMTRLIEWERTGNASMFANKLGISRSQLFIEIDELKSLDVDIKYSRSKNSFIFSGPKALKVREPLIIINKAELKKFSGGSIQKKCSVHFSGRYSFNLVSENSL